MQRLSGKHKRFIVQALACFMSPSEVREAVKAEFGIEVSRQQVQCYDPTKNVGYLRLSQTLRDLFAVTRERYLAAVYDVGLGHLRYRLGVLQHILDRAMGRKDYRLAMKVLEQAAKEVGGWYVRRRDLDLPQERALQRLLTGSPEEKERVNFS